MQKVRFAAIATAFALISSLSTTTILSIPYNAYASASDIIFKILHGLELLKIGTDVNHKAQIGQALLNYTNENTNPIKTCHSNGIDDSFISMASNPMNINTNDPNALYNNGLALFCLGRYQESINSFCKSLELDPNHADVWTNLGVDLMLGQTGRLNQSNEYFDKALQIDPNYKSALLGKNLVNVLENSK